MNLVIKALISAVFIIVITSIAKKTSLLGGLIAMMPVNIVFSLIWLNCDKADVFLLKTFIKSALFGIFPMILFLITVLFALNKWQKLGYSLFLGFFILFVIVVIQYKVLKAI